MNAHALLTSQGWRGSGHSLHPTSDKTGLSRPLLVSQKSNNLGVGKKQHNTSDMWWLNAFDKSLQGLDTSKQGEVVQTITNGGLDMVVKGGSRFVGNAGLYACFVRGEGLGGTIQEEVVVDTGMNREQRKRKRGDVGKTGESEAERKARKAAKRAKKMRKSEVVRDVADAEPAQEKSLQLKEKQKTAELAKVETKEERRERKRLKKLLKEATKQAVEKPKEKSQKQHHKSKKDRRKD